MHSVQICGDKISYFEKALYLVNDKVKLKDKEKNKALRVEIDTSRKHIDKFDQSSIRNNLEYMDS